MADDQKPKTMDINDLVRELSKSSTSSTTLPVPTTEKPSFPTTKPMTPPMAGSPVSPAPKPPVPPVTPAPPPVPKPIMPQPKFNAPPASFNQPKPVPAPSPVAPLPTTPEIKEYQSSIRTMNEDISKLKQGQQPAGVPVPRKVEQVIPTPPVISPPAKSTMPGQQFKVPSVNLGETKKTAPLAPTNIPKPPSAPKTEPKTQIYVPQEGQKGGNRNMLFMGIGAVAIAAGFAYWFFVLRSPAPEVVIETPTLTPTPTATPIQNLNSIFSGLAEVSTDTVYKDHQPADLKGEFIKIKDAQNLNTSDLILNWLVPPQSVKDNLSNEALSLLFVQGELFDTAGQIKASELERRLVLIIEAKDASLLAQAVMGWEATIADGTASLWGIDKSKQKSAAFLDNAYRGSSIRYKNFPYSDRTIDYSIILASNGKTYFVIANSREAMYATMDKLKGF